MKKRILVLLVVFLLIFSLVASVSADNGGMTVYITNTGSKYHMAGCRYLSNSSHAITLEAAVQLGKTPCSVCKPPHLSTSANSGEIISTRANSSHDSAGLASVAAIAIPAALIGYGVAKRKKE